MLLVEGEEDRESLIAIMSAMSHKVKRALETNILVIKPMNGASALAHDALELKTNMCIYKALLDNDEEANKSIQKALDKGVIQEEDIRQTFCNGSSEAEFEDCISQKLYAEAIREKYSIDILKSKHFRNDKKKWSDRVEKAFVESGLRWSDKVKKDLKQIVVDKIKAAGSIEAILIREKSGFIDGLVTALEDMIVE